MIPQDRLELLTYIRHVVPADDGYVSNFAGSAPGAVFIGLPARHAKFETPLHCWREKRLHKETATIIIRLRGDTNQAVN